MRMAFPQSQPPPEPAASDVPLRPQVLRPADRHIVLGVSHPSNDPVRHRTFEIRATYDMSTHGWIAHVGEQNLNEQRGAWAPVASQDRPATFPTAAACLGHAVAEIVAAFDWDDEADA
jgi:hypothetical protein